MTVFNYTVPPGGYLDEWLESEAMSQEELARRLGVSRKFVNQLVNGHVKLTPETAQKLEVVTGLTAHMWLTHEMAYRQELAELEAAQSYAELGKEVSEGLAAWLRRNGVTKARRSDPERLGRDLLQLHRCATPEVLESWDSELRQGEYALAARKANQKDQVDPLALGAWLRVGELRVEARPRQRFVEEDLRVALPELRRRCSRPDQQLLSDVRDFLERLGVLFTVLLPPSGFPLHGVTRWLDSGVPLIMQTGYLKNDGQVILTLFHEIGHILNDPRGETHLEFKSSAARTSAAERAANTFARDVLFGPGGTDDFRGTTLDEEIRVKARAVGIAPGVVVTELQRKHMLPRNYGNKLKVDLTPSIASFS